MNLKNQFIVYLHNDAGTRGIWLFQPVRDLYHRSLDDVSSRSLHWGIDCGALSTLTTHGVAGFNIRQIQAATVERFNIALFRSLRPRAFHIFENARIAFKIEIHITLGFFTRNVKLARKTKCAHAVNQAEVDGLRTTALLGGDALQL